VGEEFWYGYLPDSPLGSYLVWTVLADLGVASVAHALCNRMRRRGEPVAEA
jgi:hypothetical protein